MVLFDVLKANHRRGIDCLIMKHLTYNATNPVWKGEPMGSRPQLYYSFFYLIVT